MKKLILIGGALATGKSTYSLILKEKFSVNLLNKDRLKEILGDNILVTNRIENKKLSVACFDLMIYILENNFNNLVIESNFKDYELKVLKEKCNELNYDVLSIVFDAEDEILHQRFIKRLDENRHYVHKSQDFTNIEDFKNMLNDLRKGEYFGEVIRVNCDSFDYQKDQSLLDKIEEFIKK